jgi:hypothetical protein
MTHPGPSTEFAVQDINVDREGRVIITNPQIARQLNAAVTAKRPKPKPKPPNTNCNGCNTVPGCGGENMLCGPQNTVPNCGCKIE